MKLLLCRSCNDVFKLQEWTRSCVCGKTSGRYMDNLHATYSGIDAVPIGFASSSLTRAILDRPVEGEGRMFNAFVIPVLCPTFVKK